MEDSAAPASTLVTLDRTAAPLRNGHAAAELTLPVGTILQGDAAAILRDLPGCSVDLIFADPPYNLQLERELYRPNLTLVDAVDDTWDAFGGGDDAGRAAYDAFTLDWLRECRRVMRDHATIWVIGDYHNIHRVGTIMMDLGFWILNDIVWIKSNPMPNFRGVRFTNAHETLIWAKKNKDQKRYTFNYHRMKHDNGGKQMRSDWNIPICQGVERVRLADGRKVHSTQKPEALLERIVLASSNPGDTVLDPFFGTGTTGVVAKRLGRHWIGIEQHPVYVEAARHRIDATAVQEHFELDEVVEKRRLPRVPFASLVEAGLIAPGTELLFNRDPEKRAEALANGKVQFGDVEASIHRAGALAGSLPACNGWEHWYYRTPDGRLAVIDELRAAFRAASSRRE